MGSRDRDSKSLQDKLKVFFKKAGVPARGELALTAELERELGPEAPPPRRLRAARDLADRLQHLRLHEGGAERVWRAVRDLLEAGAGGAGAEARHAALGLLRALCEAQADRLSVMRTVLFRWLQDTHARRPPEDELARFRLVHALTGGGRNISCFEEAAGPFLAAWLAEQAAPPPDPPPPDLVPLKLAFLHLVTNVVKYNASSLDDDVVHAIVNCACSVLESWGGAAGAGDEGAEAALALLEAVASYSLLPLAALGALLAALCRAVNAEPRAPRAFKLLRAVAGADTGHAALLHLVRIAADESGDAGLVRGAVFFIHMALWGPRRVPALHASHLAVLPALAKAAEGGQPAVVYEVASALAAVAGRAGAELGAAAWRLLLRALAAAVAADAAAPNALTHAKIAAVFHTLQQMVEGGQLEAETEAAVLEAAAAAGAGAGAEDEALAAWVVGRRAAALHPPHWPPWARFLHAHLRAEPRPRLRLLALTHLHHAIMRYKVSYGEELAERVGGAAAALGAADAAAAVRAAAARLAAALARDLAADAAADLLDVLERILHRPFETSGESALGAEADVSDVAEAAGALAALVHERGARAAPLAARALLVLLDHLDSHYRRPHVFHHHPAIRLQVLELVFSVRVNAYGWVGFCYDESGAAVHGARAERLRPVCSPHLQLDCRPAAAREGACVVSATRVSRALATALAREAEWAVLGACVRALPALLAARAPAAGCARPHLDLLAATLCAMLHDRPPPALRVSHSELQAAVLPALAQLPPHHALLEPATQHRVVRSLLRVGMVQRSPAPYICALTVCALEMRDTMVKALPEVLLDLSKVSDTQAIAAPMLEFLSTLTRLPHIFASFVEDQYMSVFAILLPYTNPSRYNHYVVSLAHRVVGGWFLQCRPHYRRNFVRFILHGLHNYMILPFEERGSRGGGAGGGAGAGAAGGAGNEDSSNRQRSSSLGSRAVPRAPLGRPAPAPSPAAASAAFHVELTETCVDLLARHAFTPCSVKPHRSDIGDFIFEGGQSMTWLVGHKLVTITTSGCLQNPIKQGLCERCATLCRQLAERAASPLPPLAASTPAPAAPTAAAPAGADAPAHDVKRQNSGESETLAGLAARLERLERAEAEEEVAGAGAGAGARGGEPPPAAACPCWCAAWARVHVRAPTGDTAWLARLQNPPAAWAGGAGDALEELAALLPPAAPAPPATAAPAPAAAAPAPPPELSKSHSDSQVEERRPPPPAPAPARASTQPINIPGSPQRPAAADDDLLRAPPSKARHPVRRSNSSPEMSSWKLGAAGPGAGAGDADGDTPRDAPPTPADLIVLPPTAAPPAAANNAAGKKGGKKADMRVSCEAIPEEMLGTSPHAAAARPAPAPAGPAPAAPAPAPAHHPHLMTFNSDPGSEGAAPPPRHQLQKTASDSTVGAGEGGGAGAGAGEAGGAGRDDLPPLARSKRSNTISVMSPTRRHRVVRSESSGGGTAAARAGGGGGGGGLSPAFVFLQLYHNMSTYPLSPAGAGGAGGAGGAVHPLAARPLRLVGATHERTIKNLDLVPPLETYKVGVLYVGAGQAEDETAILRNEHGSARYEEFLAALGALVPLDGRAPPELFLNLDQGGADGRYTYVWADAVTQLQFHVGTALPSRAADPACNEKRKHIGNDLVSIVYNDSHHDFNIHTIKGQLNLCIVVVEPLEGGLSRVLVKSKDERVRQFRAHQEPHVVADHSAALLARQTALHCCLAAQVSKSLTLGGAPYASNALERLRLIKRLRARAEAERLAAAERAPAPYAPHLSQRIAIDDFNDYT